jgi:hypothetical protein
LWQSFKEVRLGAVGRAGAAVDLVSGSTGLKVKPLELIGSAFVEGGQELRLMRRGADFAILLGRNELMNSRMSGSEEALADDEVARGIAGARDADVLIGGYGMGFTLRAALGVLPAGARVTVAEVVPEIVAWARGPMAGLNRGGPVDDPRVALVDGDVADLIRGARARTTRSCSMSTRAGRADDGQQRPALYRQRVGGGAGGVAGGRRAGGVVGGSRRGVRAAADARGLRRGGSGCSRAVQRQGRAARYLVRREALGFIPRRHCEECGDAAIQSGTCGGHEAGSPRFARDDDGWVDASRQALSRRWSVGFLTLRCCGVRVLLRFSSSTVSSK